MFLRFVIALLCTLALLLLLFFAITEARAEVPTLDASALTSDSTAMPTQDVVVWGRRHTLVWTFDDHPSRWTEATLDLLKQHGIKGTFFIAAYALWTFYQQPSYVPSQRFVASTRRAATEGHRIGGHSLTHRRLCQIPPRELRRVEFDLAQTILRRVVGVSPKLWRPPHGELCGPVRREIARLGLTSVLWDLADYKTSAPRMITLLKRRVEAGFTSTIVLFHPNHNDLLRAFLKQLAAVRTAPL